MFQAIQRKSSFFADFRKNGNKILLGTALSGFLCTEESRRPHLMASLGALESTSELIETSSPIRTQFWSKRILYTLLGPGFMDFLCCEDSISAVFSCSVDSFLTIDAFVLSR